MIRPPIIVLVAILLAAPPALAGVAPIGPVLQVNSYTTGAQDRPSVAASASGFVIIWDGYGAGDPDGLGIIGRLFDSAGSPRGGEFLVNAYTTGDQSDPAVAMDSTGSFVVVWGSDTDVHGRLFDGSGAALGVEFQINQFTTFGQTEPTVGMEPGGDFAVAWQSIFQDGDDWGVFARRYDSAGQPLGGEFQVNTYTTSYQYTPALAMGTGGEFVVTWVSSDGSTSGVLAQRFDSSGAPAGSEFTVNTYTDNIQRLQSVAKGANDEFVVVWEGAGGVPESQTGIFGQLFDSAGTPQGGQFHVNTYTPSFQYLSHVAADGDGGFTVLWSGQTPSGAHSDVLGQKFDSSGAPVASEFQVSRNMLGDAYEISATGDGGNGMVIAWGSLAEDGSDRGVFARRVVTNGPSITQPAATDVLDCSNPGLNRPVFEWDPGDYDRFKVFMGSSPGFEKGTRVTSGDKAIRDVSWSPSVKKWKNACRKAIEQSADPNNPVMYVAVEGLDQDLLKKDPARKLLSFTLAADVQP